MSQQLLYSLCGIGLFGIGLYHLLVLPAMVRKILAINIMGIGVFMLLVAGADRPDAAPAALAFDPVPHAMVLTGIVVAVAGSALALSLICRIHELQTRGDNEQSAGDRQ